MTAKPSNVGRPLQISEVLQAYFALDATTQQQIHDQVKKWSAAEISQAERDRIERTLTMMLRLGGDQKSAGPLISQEERLTPAHQEVRGRMDKAEEAFAATLARLMAERQLTQAQLAEKIGVGQSAISMFLKRRSRPQRRTLGKLAEALGVSVEELWPGFGMGWKSGMM